MKLHKSYKHTYRSVLNEPIWTLRLFWIGLTKFLVRGAKLSFLLAIIAGIGWGVHVGVQRAFYDNPDFNLQTVDINPNQAVDDMDFTRITGIQPHTNLFKINVKAVTKQLVSLPDVADAHVERRLPGTLLVRVSARVPRAWLACPAAGLPAERKVGAMLVDFNDIAYPCSARQLEAAAKLLIIVLPAKDNTRIAVGEKIRHPELQRCIRLLTAIRDSDPEALLGIDSIKQVNAWSLALTTRSGTVATFGLGDHARQVSNLRAALNHAAHKGYAIATINMIPKENIPVTVSNKPPPPRAVPVATSAAQEPRQGRRSADLKPKKNQE